MLKFLCAGCLGLSPANSVQFMLEMCAAAWNREKFTKTSFTSSDPEPHVHPLKARHQCLLW